MNQTPFQVSLPSLGTPPRTRSPSVRPRTALCQHPVQPLATQPRDDIRHILNAPRSEHRLSQPDSLLHTEICPFGCPGYPSGTIVRIASASRIFQSVRCAVISKPRSQPGPVIIPSGVSLSSGYSAKIPGASGQSSAHPPFGHLPQISILCFLAVLYISLE